MSVAKKMVNKEKGNLWEFVGNRLGCISHRKDRTGTRLETHRARFVSCCVPIRMTVKYDIKKGGSLSYRKDHHRTSNGVEVVAGSQTVGRGQDRRRGLK